MEFLAIETRLTANKNYEIKIIFAGDSIISIFTEEIDVLLDDRGKAWSVKKIPKHKI